MELQKLALDVSAGSGKSLEAVTQALARAQEGNTASLGRLGIGLSAAQLKTMSMNDVTSTLADTFAGAADTAANTFEGKMTRLGLAFEDVRDTVGGFVLDTITPMVETFVTKVMPALSDFATSLSERVQPAIKVIQPIINGLRSAFNSVRDSLEANNTQLQPFYDFMVGIFNFAKDFLAPVIGKTLGGAFTILGKLISGVITTFAGFVNQLNSIFERITGIINAIRSAAGAVSGFFGGNDSPTPSTPRVSSPKLPQVTQSPSPMNITVNGAIDPEGTARTIVNVLNNSQARGTLGAAGLVGR
jgi:phage-related protein